MSGFSFPILLSTFLATASVTNEQRTFAHWFGDGDVVAQNVNHVPVAGTDLGVHYLWNNSTVSAYESGALWSNTAYAMWKFSAEFTAVNSPGSGEAPTSAVWITSVSTSTVKDNVAAMFEAKANASNVSLFGFNAIVWNAAGTNNCYFRGGEIDIQPAAGTTGHIFVGLFFTMFTQGGGSAIQIQGAASGSWANGIVVYSATSAGLAAGAGTTLGALVHTGSSITYTEAAIVVSNTHKIKIAGSASAHGFLYADGSNFMHLVVTTNGLAIRDNSDTTTLVYIASGGSIDIQTGVLKVASTQVVGVQGAAVADASGGAIIDVQARAQLNLLLARCRLSTGHGLIAG